MLGNNVLKACIGRWSTKILRGNFQQYIWSTRFGCDEMSKIYFKKLWHIYNASLESDIFPDRLKIITVEPLHKRKKIQNYRLISFLLAISKILGTLLKNRLTAFIIKNNILTQAQNDFREGKI